MGEEKPETLDFVKDFQEYLSQQTQHVNMISGSVSGVKDVDDLPGGIMSSYFIHSNLHVQTPFTWVVVCMQQIAHISELNLDVDCILFCCFVKISVKMVWTIPLSTLRWMTAQAYWWTALRGPMMANWNAATVTMPPGAQLGSSSTSASTQVRDGA